MRSIRVRIKPNQFDGLKPEETGFKVGRTYKLIPFMVRGQRFYRRSKGVGVWLDMRFDIVK